jgi:hypothetical protein
MRNEERGIFHAEAQGRGERGGGFFGEGSAEGCGVLTVSCKGFTGDYIYLIVHCKCLAWDYESSIVAYKDFTGDYDDLIVLCKCFE